MYIIFVINAFIIRLNTNGIFIKINFMNIYSQKQYSNKYVFMHAHERQLCIDASAHDKVA